MRPRYTPRELSAPQYGQIRRLIVEQLPEGPSCEPISSAYAVTSNIPPYEYYDQDRSLTTQLDHVVNHAESLHGSGADKPDAYALTVLSAIPLADALRGFHAARDEPEPVLIPVDIEKLIPRRHIGDAIVASEHLGTVINSDDAETILGDLRRVRHVCVIDEYILSGRTLHYAGMLLKAAGVDQVSAIRGDWYLQAEEGTVDVGGLTSSHASFMYDIGQEVAAIIGGTDHSIDTDRFANWQST